MTKRFEFKTMQGVGLGFYVRDYPYAVTVDVALLLWCLTIGLGRVVD